MISDDPIDRLLEFTITMREHAIAKEWNMLTGVEQQRTQFFQNAVRDKIIIPEQSPRIEKLRRLQAEVLNLAIAERTRLQQDYQSNRSKIQTSNYYLSDGSKTDTRKPPKSESPADKEAI